MAVHIRAGRYRHRITIQQTTQTRDSYGGVADTWSTYVAAWASIEPLQIGSREWFDAQKVNAEVSHLVKMRYRSGVIPKMRIAWDSRTFDVRVVLNAEERDRELQMLVMEAV